MGIFKRKRRDKPEPKLPFMNSIVLAFLRHILTFIGGAIVSKGLIDEATMIELVGAAISFISVAWMAVGKLKKQE